MTKLAHSLASLILRSEVTETMDVGATLQSQWTEKGKEKSRERERIRLRWGCHTMVYHSLLKIINKGANQIARSSSSEDSILSFELSA